jgi:hypothetical protein
MCINRFFSHLSFDARTHEDPGIFSANNSYTKASTLSCWAGPSCPPINIRKGVNRGYGGQLSGPGGRAILKEGNSRGFTLLPAPHKGGWGECSPQKTISMRIALNKNRYKIILYRSIQISSTNSLFSAWTIQISSTKSVCCAWTIQISSTKSVCLARTIQIPSTKTVCLARTIQILSTKYVCRARTIQISSTKYVCRARTIQISSTKTVCLAWTIQILSAKSVCRARSIQIPSTKSVCYYKSIKISFTKSVCYDKR